MLFFNNYTYLLFHTKLNLYSYLFILSVLMLLACSETKEEPKTHEEVSENPTFVEIAPIIYKNCTPCHRKGESGPNELLTYDDIKKNANKIKFVTQTRFMPPWPADPNYTHFIGERVLTKQEITLIKTWVENGTPLGDADKVPLPPVFQTGYNLRKPDAVIKIQEAIKIKGNGTDHFFIVKMPSSIPKDTFVSYFEYVPSNRKLAHHVNGHLVNYKEGAKQNLRNGISYDFDNYHSNYVPLYEKMNLLNDDGTFPTLTPNTVYYLPGFTPQIYPNGIGGYRMNKTSAILLANLHFGPSAIDVLDSSYINVFYGAKPKRPVYETQLGTFGISKIEPELIIQPNKIQTFHTQGTLNGDASILSINPHMHLLGKSFWAFIVTPNQDTIPLIKINKWDFRWQYYYTFPNPVKYTKGSVIHVYGTFDNTAQNPNNPNRPPKLVTQGDGTRSMRTTEEMFQFIFTYMPYQPGDEHINLQPNIN